MKRVILCVCLLAVLILPVFAVTPLTDLELASAAYDSEHDRFLYDGNWYDGAGYPLYTQQSQETPVEDNTSNSDMDVTEDAELDSDSELDDSVQQSDSEDARLIHQEDLTGNTQVNVFAIQTEDETGGAWIQGGSGETLTEKLFGEYVPYNASGIASVDWAWIADVVLFAILVVCFFKIVAGVMKRV